MIFEEVQRRLEACGLLARGGFHPEPGDEVPALDSGAETRTLVMSGNAGPGMWRAFRSAGEHSETSPNPMNAWTERVLTDAAGDLGAGVVFPFGGPPYHPFQRWAGRCEPVSGSPIGILIHPTYGLWHAYRGALLFAEHLDLPQHSEISSPCLACETQPCLTTCPVGAFTVQGYDVEGCAGYLRGNESNDCLTQGCRARRACPAGRDYVYAPEQARFHMRAFARALGRRLDEHTGD